MTSLYIHIPWCIRKCPYCDFNSHKSPNHLPEEAYVARLMSDFQQDLTFFSARTIDSLFIGGGTPSLFSAKAYESLFNQLQSFVTFKNGIEITLEANPGAIEQQRFKDYRALGINRLSIGIQSFNPIHLKRLGRVHDDSQAHSAILTARKAGFTNINIDIMHSLPHQSPEEGLEDLKKALSYFPEHLSWYQLTLEPNTLFYKQRPPLPNEDEIEELEASGLEFLSSNGFQRYEISAFCQPNRPSFHNLNYWLFGDYFGIGAGAHGKISDSNTIYRTRKQRQPNDYLNPNKNVLVAKDKITEEDTLFEFMLNTTRLQQAIPMNLFSERTQLPFEKLYEKLKFAASKKLIILTESTWQVSELGRRFTNNLQELFLPN